MCRNYYRAEIWAEPMEVLKDFVKAQILAQPIMSCMAYPVQMTG
jgi:hypothetical protein